MSIQWSEIEPDIRDKVVLRLKMLNAEVRLEKTYACNPPIQEKTVSNINSLQDTIEFYIQLLHNFADDMSMVKPFKGEIYHRQMIRSVLIDAAEKTRHRFDIEYRNGFMELVDRLNAINDAFLCAIKIIEKH